MTPTIRTIISDDEPLAREKLRILLASEAGVRIVAECRDGRQTIDALRTYKPDLLLLDIQMPGADGFQVLSTIPADDIPLVVFTTAYDQYAIRAFETHAVDYLLKPFDHERLHKAIERTRSELLKTNDREMTQRILDLLASSRVESRVAKRLVIKAAGRVVFLDVEEIDWVEAAANYVKLHVGRESHLLRESIGRISERLDPDRFVRVHRSTIVNVRRIKERSEEHTSELQSQ